MSSVWKAASIVLLYHLHSLSIGLQDPPVGRSHPSRWLPWLFPSSLWYMCLCLFSLSPWCCWTSPPPRTQTDRRNRWINKTSQPLLWILITLGLRLWTLDPLWCCSVPLPAFQESQHSKYSAHPKGCRGLPWCSSPLFCPYFMFAQFQKQLCIISCVGLCVCVWVSVCVFLLFFHIETGIVGRPES